MKDTITGAVLFQILSLAPMGESAVTFRRLASDGDVEGFYRYYEACMHKMPHLDAQIEAAGQISFRMLQPAMSAVYMAGRPNSV